MNEYLGELAGIAASIFYAGSSTVNTLAGRVVGSFLLNRTRVVLAIFWLTLAHFLFGAPLSLDADPKRWFWLSVSGILGLAIGDAFLFQAFIWIGPRLSMLLMALAPAMAGVLAWIFLGEILSLSQWAGMALTIAGIAWVIFSKNGTEKVDQPLARFTGIGILFGIGAAAGQALGQVTAKLGLYGNYSAFSASFIRMSAAAVVLWGLAIYRRQASETFTLMFAQPRAAWLILIGSILGPFLGVTSSLYALQNTPVGVASTLTALSPIILLPIGYFFFKERFGWQAIAGTILAMIGVLIFFLI